MPLRFDSDLVVSVDGLEGRVVGDGSTLRVETSDPARFLDEVRAAGPSDTRSIRRAAEFLHDRGVTVVVMRSVPCRRHTARGESGPVSRGTSTSMSTNS